jgi:hypothetical protein
MFHNNSILNSAVAVVSGVPRMTVRSASCCRPPTPTASASRTISLTHVRPRTRPPPPYIRQDRPRGSRLGHATTTDTALATAAIRINCAMRAHANSIAGLPRIGFHRSSPRPTIELRARSAECRSTPRPPRPKDRPRTAGDAAADRYRVVRAKLNCNGPNQCRYRT